MEKILELQAKVQATLKEVEEKTKRAREWEAEIQELQRRIDPVERLWSGAREWWKKVGAKKFDVEIPQYHSEFVLKVTGPMDLPGVDRAAYYLSPPGHPIPLTLFNTDTIPVPYTWLLTFDKEGRLIKTNPNRCGEVMDALRVLFFKE